MAEADDTASPQLRLNFRCDGRYACDMQPELNFNTPGSGGYELWLKQRQSLVSHLTDQLGFPIGREAEVWLRGGIRLRGKLTVREDTIHWSSENKAVGVELGIGQVYFPIAEIESCVRIN